MRNIAAKFNLHNTGPGSRARERESRAAVKKRHPRGGDISPLSSLRGDARAVNDAGVERAIFRAFHRATTRDNDNNPSPISARYDRHACTRGRLKNSSRAPVRQRSRAIPDTARRFDTLFVPPLSSRFSDDRCKSMLMQYSATRRLPPLSPSHPLSVAHASANKIYIPCATRSATGKIEFEDNFRIKATTNLALCRRAVCSPPRDRRRRRNHRR